MANVIWAGRSVATAHKHDNCACLADGNTIEGRKRIKTERKS